MPVKREPRRARCDPDPRHRHENADLAAVGNARYLAAEEENNETDTGEEPAEGRDWSAMYCLLCEWAANRHTLRIG